MKTLGDPGLGAFRFWNNSLAEPQVEKISNHTGLRQAPTHLTTWTVGPFFLAKVSVLTTRRCSTHGCKDKHAGNIGLGSTCNCPGKAVLERLLGTQSRGIRTHIGEKVRHGSQWKRWNPVSRQSWHAGNYGHGCSHTWFVMHEDWQATGCQGQCQTSREGYPVHLFGYGPLSMLPSRLGPHGPQKKHSRNSGQRIQAWNSYI